jgi:diadenosine tetraphosphatase ApaH/serine/threonine PP2A family protein phosphatase
MKVGIVSDVHANAEALDAVLVYLKNRVDVMAFLGDAVGYGPDPLYVCETLQSVCKYAVMGNHDAACIGRLDDKDYYDSARMVLEWTRRQLEEKHVQWLSRMPYTMQMEDVLFCHAMPENPGAFEYLFGPDDALSLLDGYATLRNVTFIGHSHLTLAYRLEPMHVQEEEGPLIYCDPSYKYIITAGSVGQPRDRNPEACCGVYDSETRFFERHRVPYDVHTTRKKISDAGLPSFFGDRLVLGV